MRFYTYIYLDPKNGKPIYVGKGCLQRLRVHLYKTMKSRLSRTLKNRMAEGFEVKPIITYHNDEETAFAMEMALIAYIGREDLGLGTLFNLTDGGDGMANPTQETREKLKKRIPWNRGKVGLQKCPESKKEAQRKMCGALSPSFGKPGGFTGHKHSEETKMKISESEKATKALIRQGGVL